jgi:hypothetical protein
MGCNRRNGGWPRGVPAMIPVPDFPRNPKWPGVLRWCLAVTDLDHPSRAQLNRLADKADAGKLSDADKRQAWPITRAIWADWEAQRLPCQWRARQATIDRLKWNCRPRRGAYA